MKQQIDVIYDFKEKSLVIKNLYGLNLKYQNVSKETPDKINTFFKEDKILKIKKFLEFFTENTEVDISFSEVSSTSLTLSFSLLTQYLNSGIKRISSELLNFQILFQNNSFEIIYNGCDVFITEKEYSYSGNITEENLKNISGILKLLKPQIDKEKFKNYIFNFEKLLKLFPKKNDVFHFTPKDNIN